LPSAPDCLSAWARAAMIGPSFSSTLARSRSDSGFVAQRAPLSTNAFWLGQALSPTQNGRPSAVSCASEVPADNTSIAPSAAQTLMAIRFSSLALS
jgi:hypothetical protein